MRNCENCDAPLPESSRVGRPRRFCSDRCRQASRSKAAPVTYISALSHRPSPADEGVAYIEYLRGGVAVGLRLGRQSQPELAWRYQTIAERLSDSLAELFPGTES